MYSLGILISRRIWFRVLDGLRIVVQRGERSNLAIILSEEYGAWNSIWHRRCHGLLWYPRRHFVRIKEKELFCVQLWISEGQLGLDPPQVWEDTNSAVFTLPTLRRRFQKQPGHFLHGFSPIIPFQSPTTADKLCWGCSQLKLNSTLRVLLYCILYSNSFVLLKSTRLN